MYRGGKELCHMKSAQKRNSRVIVFVLCFLIACIIMLSGCGSLSRPTSTATSTLREDGSTLITTLHQNEVFVAYGSKIIIRNPDTSGSQKILLQVEKGVLV